MTSENEKPKIRVIKAGTEKPRSGTIAVEGKDGKSYWRMQCDRCTNMATVPFRPSEGREVVCSLCFKELAKAKPSTRVIRKKDKKPVYVSDCEMCGDRVQTPFAPFHDKYLLCNGCRDAEREEKQRARDEAKAAARAEAEAAREAALEAGEAEPVEPTETESDITEQTSPVEVAETEEAVATEVETAPSEDPKPEPRHEVGCAGCDKVLVLKFMPSPNKPLYCPDCYDPNARPPKKEKPEKPARAKFEKPPRKKSETRIFFNIDCAECGKKETVDFVPKRRSEAICNECFEKRKQRRK